MVIERLMINVKSFVGQEGFRDENVSLGKYSGSVAVYADEALRDNFCDEAMDRGVKIGFYAGLIYAALC